MKNLTKDLGRECSGEKINRNTENRFKSSLKQKLSSTKGETLAEVLVAVLIAAVGLLLLSSMLMSSSKLVESGNQEVKTIYDGGSAIEKSAATEAAGKPVVLGEITGIDKTITIKWGEGYVNSAGDAVSVKEYKDTESGLALYEKSTAKAVTP